MKTDYKGNLRSNCNSVINGFFLLGFPSGSPVKNLPPATQETWQEARVRPLGQKDPQEKRPSPVFLPGKPPGHRSLVGYRI